MTEFLKSRSPHDKKILQNNLRNLVQGSTQMSLKGENEVDTANNLRRSNL